MSNVINIADLKKDRIKDDNKDNKPSSKQDYIDRIKLALNTYLTENFPDISEPVEITANLTNEEETINIKSLIFHYINDEVPISFDEWVSDPSDTHIVINDIEHTKSSITPFAFRTFINDLGNDDILSASLLQILCGIDAVCLDCNKKTIVTPIFKEVGNIKVYGINYVLETDNGDMVVLVVTVTRIFN